MSGFKPTRQSNDIRPPMAGEVYAMATTAASVAYVSPAELIGAYATFAADGDAVHIQFGGPSVTADKTAVAGEAGSPITLTASADSTIKIADGQMVSFRLPPAATNFAVQGAAGGGFVRFWLSSN
jgi:hypothetical protein